MNIFSYNCISTSEWDALRMSPRTPGNSRRPGSEHQCTKWGERNAPSAIISLVISASLFLVTSQARAENENTPIQNHAETSHTAHKQGELDYHIFELSVGPAALRAIRRDEPWFVGAGISGTFTIIPEIYEIEVVFHVLRAHQETAYPIDLLMRVPFEITTKVRPYIGIGPTFVPIVTEEKNKFIFGAGSSAGVDYWIRHDIGVFAEINANILYEEGLLLELGPFAGVNVGW